MNEHIEKQSLSIFSFEIGTHTGCGRHIGFMVRVLTSGWNCPGSSPCGEHCVMNFILTVPLSTQVYKFVGTSKFNAWGYPVID